MKKKEYKVLKEIEDMKKTVAIIDYAIDYVRMGQHSKCGPSSETIIRRPRCLKSQPTCLR